MQRSQMSWQGEARKIEPRQPAGNGRHRGRGCSTSGSVYGSEPSDLCENASYESQKEELTQKLQDEELRSGEIDLYPEYTGTGYSTILKNKLRPGFTPDEMYTLVKQQMRDTHQIELLESFGFNNTYVLAVTQATAAKYHLKTMTDLTRVSHNLRFGCSPEFAARDDGLPGIEKTYGMTFKSVNNFSGTLMYTAITSDNVDVITAFSTDGLLQKYDLVLLEDDKNFFPPYYMLPFVNGKTNAEYPEIAQALSVLNSAIDDATMQKLNYEVVEKAVTGLEVARTFLLERGLVKAGRL